jgi:anti-anti-sigma regulatory factor
LEPTAGSILVKTTGSRVCISVSGRATERHAPLLCYFTDQMLCRGYDRFELDLANCTDLDSALLGTLARLSSRLAQSGFGRWSVQHISARNLDLFTTLGVDRCFEIDGPSKSAAARKH